MRAENMSINEKIVVRENKILKLNNILIRPVSKNEFMNINKISYMMDSYIKTKGNCIVGPIINYSGTSADKNGQVNVELKLMVQLKYTMHNIEAPYEFSNQIRVTNCLFARFSEKEENLQFAYTKSQLYAFENDIKLKGDSYTVFVENKEGRMVADVFMEVQKEDLTLESL